MISCGRSSEKITLNPIAELRLQSPVLNAESRQALVAASDTNSLRRKRDFATLAILLGCGLRRGELSGLRVEELQQTEEHWLIADLVGKGAYENNSSPGLVKAGIDAWIGAAGISSGTVLRSINKAGRFSGNGFSPKVIWGGVKQKANECEIPSLAPHDLRRTCARLSHQAGGELEQIQFLLGHVSVQTTERYLACKQRFRNAVNDRIGLEPDRWDLNRSHPACRLAVTDPSAALGPVCRQQITRCRHA